jgi:hypothetical protein
MTFTTKDPVNLSSIMTDFGEHPYNLEVVTTTNQTYTLPTNFPLTTYVMNIAHTSDSTGTLIVNGITIPNGDMSYFVFSPETGTWYSSPTVAGGGGITQLTGGVTAGPGSGSQVATVVTNANLTGAVTSVGNATSLTSTSVTAAVLTGYVSGAGTISATDTILTAVDKLNGNDGTKLPLAGGTLTGVLTPASSTNASLTGTVTPVTNVTNYIYTVTGTTTLNGPASPTADMQKVTFRILNDATHSVTLATGAGNFRFGTDITSYTNSVSLTDYIGAIWNNAATRWDVVSIIQGF